MPNKKNMWSITMVDPKHIASKKYRSCGTTRSVSNFCSKHRVNRFWWRPPSGGQKVMMIDFQNFKESYKDVFGVFPRTTFTKTTKTKSNWNTRSTPKLKSSKTRSYTSTRKTNRTKTRRAA